MREHVYPRRIAANRMSREKAARELDLMRAVLKTLEDDVTTSIKGE